MTAIPWARAYRSGGAARWARRAEVAERLARPALELGRLLRDPVYWGVGVARGDGHAVIALPGLGAGDRSLAPLRRWLRRAGYTTVRSGIERNPGWSEELAEELTALVERTARETGRPVTLIGHSMGGVLAHAVARRRPGAVRQVIALGSPLRMTRGPLPAGVRLTAVLSPDDRIVRSETARPREAHARTIEVRGSHTGMIVNADVYRELARLLSATDGDADLL